MADAVVNVTFAGQNGELRETVPFDAPDTDIKRYVTEAIRTGSVPGIPGDLDADFTDYMVDRFEPTDARPTPLLALRPKTPFG